MGLHRNKQVAIKAYFAKIIRERGGPTPVVVKRIKTELDAGTGAMKNHMEEIQRLLDEVVEEEKVRKSLH